ncbi:hypothetical protein CXF96_13595 [Stenotrophomonas sp. Betaine-02u-21]|nr:hypothetical protein CXF90_12835 [Stenotrophomonas sp. Betaine-02u-23]PKH73011.1 hypothetical protein CXF96_13595 [Stenotrophomonas sp. Betaine-02u-21]PKH96798.1 hypothetical protein CXG43_05975 [Stenotrophomonas sp. Bg11-02]
MAGMVHNAIVAASVKWLRRNGCAAILADPFRASCREQPDAIGWRDGVSLAVEVKASRSDFLADAKKPHRIELSRRSATGDSMPPRPALSGPKTCLRAGGFWNGMANP